MYMTRFARLNFDEKDTNFRIIKRITEENVLQTIISVILAVLLTVSSSERGVLNTVLISVKNRELTIIRENS